MPDATLVSHHSSTINMSIERKTQNTRYIHRYPAINRIELCEVDFLKTSSYGVLLFTYDIREYCSIDIVWYFSQNLESLLVKIEYE